MGLKPSVRDDAWELIERAGGTAATRALVATITPADTVLLSGSLVDGLGNARSDLDLYVVGEARDAPVRMAVMGSSYVDYERLSTNSVAELGIRLNRHPSDDWLADTSISDLDRYYRLAIGLALCGPGQHSPALAALDRAHLCIVLAHWAELHANANAARALLAAGQHRLRHAAAYAHEAVFLTATADLARAGDGYPSLKWTEEKARRTFGDGSTELAAFLSLAGFDHEPGAYVDRAVAWVRAHTSRPADPPADHPSTVADGVVLVRGGATGVAVAIGRSKLYPVVKEDIPAVRTLCGRPEATDRAALSALPARERHALLVVVRGELLRTKVLRGDHS